MPDMRDREDMIASFEKTANRDLDWFFDQWLETTWQLDYAVDDVDGSWQNKDGERNSFMGISSGYSKRI